MVLITVIVGFTAEWLVSSINGLVESNPSLSAEWVGLILLPIVCLSLLSLLGAAVGDSVCLSLLMQEVGRQCCRALHRRMSLRSLVSLTLRLDHMLIRASGVGFGQRQT